MRTAIPYWLLNCAAVTFLPGCSPQQSTAVFDAEHILCPAPAIAEYAPWGASGSVQSCKIRHGPVVMYQSGRVNVRGQYDMGKETGVWNWYDKAGKVVKSVDYSKKR